MVSTTHSATEGSHPAPAVRSASRILVTGGRQALPLLRGGSGSNDTPGVLWDLLEGPR